MSSTINIEKISIAHWYPELETHKCGYCKSENGAVSYGMWAEQLTVEDYQNLIDRGWRRSGMYCYKPMMDQTCCPQYTIRCKALEFQASKSQKKIIKKFNKFLNDGAPSKPNNRENFSVQEDEAEPVEHFVSKERPNIHLDMDKMKSIHSKTDTVDQNLESDAALSANTSSKESNVKKDSSNTAQVASKSDGISGTFKQGAGADPSKPPCKKAKLLRLERRQQKLTQRGMSLERVSASNTPKTLEQFLNEIPVDAKHKLKIELVPVLKILKEEDLKTIEYQLYKKYQMVIHNDPPEKCSIHGFTRFLISSPLKIKHERVNKNHSTFKICAALFKKYQMAIHKEPPNECGEKQFCEFLVDTPLKSIRVRGDTVGSVTYGTFHQQYWIDDKLIAVGVLDILPKCISSVYFFYDPDYSFLTLGTYGALREIQYVQSLHGSIPAIEYYYMGFYIHSCPKMRYKGKFSNSHLVCPETYHWFPLEKCIPKLDINKYSRLHEDIDAVDENMCTSADVDRIKVCVSYSFTIYGNYKQKYGEQDVFDNIGRLIGKKCASSILFVSSKG